LSIAKRLEEKPSAEPSASGHLKDSWPDLPSARARNQATSGQRDAENARTGLERASRQRCALRLSAAAYSTEALFRHLK